MDQDINSASLKSAASSAAKARITQNFDYRRLIANILLNWYWLVGAVAVALLCGFLYLRYSEPMYSVTTTLQIAEQNELQSQVLSNMPGSRNSGSNIEKMMYNEIFILTSPDIMRKVVDSLQSNVHIWAKGRVRENEIYEERPYRIIFDSSGYLSLGSLELLIKQEGRNYLIREGKNVYRIQPNVWIKKPWGTFMLEELHGGKVQEAYRKDDLRVLVNTVGAEAARMNGALSVGRADSRTSMLYIEIRDNNRMRGLDYLEVLTAIYFRQGLNGITQSGLRVRNFINNLKGDQLEQLKNKDARIESIRRSADMSDPTQSAALVSGKLTTEQKVNDLMVQKQSLQQFRDAVASSNSNSTRAFGSLGASVDPELATLLTDYNKAVQIKQQLEENLGAGSLSPQLEAAENDLIRRRRQMISVADRAITTIDLYMRTANQNLTELNAQISGVPSVDRSMKDVNREYDVTQGTYLLLFQKGIENEISLNSADTPGRVIVAPNGSHSPISPVSRNIYSIALAFGLLIPITFFALKELFNTKVINESDIHSMSDLPIIGAVSKAPEEVDIVVGDRVRTGIAEQFRLIRTNLDFMTSSGHNGKAIMITSSMSGEGKTFISINLALTMALAGKKVALLEFDLRKPKITERLKLPRMGGISGYLAEMNGFDQLLQPSGIHPNLMIAGSGPVPPNPGELILTPRTKEMFDQLERMFDVVIIDTPPVGLVSDALVLSQYAATNIAVTRQAYTEKGQVAFLSSIRKQGKLKNLAFVFNGV